MGKEKILLVDDEPNIVRLTKSRLEANNYEVITAYNGPEAIDKAEESKPDLILLDIIMPGMNGHEVCRELKTEETTRNIPIIIFTASQEKELEKRCMEAGAIEVIKKPFESSKLLGLIKKVLES